MADESQADYRHRIYMRPNAHLWIRPDAHLYMRPNASRYLRHDHARLDGPEAYDRKDAPQNPHALAWTGKRGRWMPENGGDRTLDQSTLLSRKSRLAAFESDLAKLKSELAWLRFQRAFSRYVQVRLKANFNPAQPRVSAGNPDGGQWTSEGGSSNRQSQEGRVWLAGDKPPQIPEEQPKTQKESLSIAKDVARRLAALGRVLRRLSVPGWILEFLPEIRSYNDAPKTLEELQQNALGPSQRGYNDHHVAEQKSAEDYGFPRSMIDAPENIVRIPTWKHHEINGWYGRRNPEFEDQSPREYLRDKDWNERTRVGLQALIDHGVLKP
jgi:hypothetical protein